MGGGGGGNARGCNLLHDWYNSYCKQEQQQQPPPPPPPPPFMFASADDWFAYLSASCAARAKRLKAINRNTLSALFHSLHTTAFRSLFFSDGHRPHLPGLPLRRAPRACEPLSALFHCETCALFAVRRARRASRLWLCLYFRTFVLVGACVGPLWSRGTGSGFAFLLPHKTLTQSGSSGVRLCSPTQTFGSLSFLFA